MTVFFKKIGYKIIHSLWKLKYPDRDLPVLEERNIQNLKILIDRYALLEKLPNGGTVVELGVEYGEFAEQIMLRCRPAELHLVDVWKNKKVLNACKERIGKESAVHFHQCTSLEFLNACEEDSIDWLYIDTDHGYEMTLAELRAASRVIKKDGLICGHDYTLISSQGIRRYGVIQAVHIFCKEQDYEMVYLTHETHRHLSFALRKMP